MFIINKMGKICFFVIALVLLFGVLAVAGAVSDEKPEKITFIHYKDGKVKVID